MAGQEIQFLEPIIQRIQSFLTGKEAARTTIVSKSWHSAWLTRPNLDLDDTHFSNEFSKYAKKTIKRYEKSNLKIESFKLCMETNCYGRADLANKLIVKALRIGAITLRFRATNSPSISPKFVLPHEVFGADNLVGLSVSGCKINLDDGVVIKCRKLQSLILDGVDITANTLSSLISGCPSIEKLSLLSHVYFHYHNRNVREGQRWNDLDGWGGGQEEEHERARREREAREAVAAAIAVDNLLYRLRCLVLSNVSFETSRLGDLLPRFTLLKDFTLHLDCKIVGVFEEEIQISSCSIENVKLGVEDVYHYCYTSEGRMWRLRVKFDVPSVCKFTFEGHTIPLLSLMSTPSREWESHVSINCQQYHDLTTFLFDELSEFLTKLSQSKTHLSLHVGGFFDYKLGDNIIQGLGKHELENLTMDMTNLPYLCCYALFDGLFRLCRPKLITQYYEDDPDKRRYVHPYNHINLKKTSIDFVCRTLEQGINVKVSSPAQFMYGLNDLEEVKAQAFELDDFPAEWRPIPLETLLDADAGAPHEDVQAQQRVRLLLKWKPS